MKKKTLITISLSVLTVSLSSLLFFGNQKLLSLDTVATTSYSMTLNKDNAVFVDNSFTARTNRGTEISFVTSPLASMENHSNAFVGINRHEQENVAYIRNVTPLHGATSINLKQIGSSVYQTNYSYYRIYGYKDWPENKLSTKTLLVNNYGESENVRKNYTVTDLKGCDYLSIESDFTCYFSSITINFSCVEYNYDRIDVIPFGMYPQSEVTDTTLYNSLLAITGVCKPLQDDIKSRVSGINNYKYTLVKGENGENWVKDNEHCRPDFYSQDITYNGNKYRAVCRGYYQQQKPNDNYYYYFNDEYKFFKYEPIYWRYLRHNDEYVEIHAIKGLDAVSWCNYSDGNEWKTDILAGNVLRERTTYDGTKTDNVTFNNYEFSTLRGYINTIFYSDAFNYHEQTEIVKGLVDNSKDSSARGVGSYYQNQILYNCDDTYDKVYLLCYRDIRSSSNIDWEDKLPNSPTDYCAYMMSVSTDSEINIGFRSTYPNDDTGEILTLGGYATHGMFGPNNPVSIAPVIKVAFDI